VDLTFFGLPLREINPMDQFKEYRLTYLAAAPHSFYTAMAWITSAAIADNISIRYAIIFFIVALTFTFPAGELVRKVFQQRNFITAGNKLDKLFMLSAFTIPCCYPIIYFACKTNINYFFPSFSILIGAHYLIFVYAYDRLVFLLLAIVMITVALVSVYLFPNVFSVCGYFVGVSILLTGIYNFWSVKKELQTKIT
jgi:hypothetical protein